MSVRNRIYSPVRYQLRSTDPYGVPIEARFDGEKEEGVCGCGVFAAPAQTAEAEWSRLLLTHMHTSSSNSTSDGSTGSAFMTVRMYSLTLSRMERRETVRGSIRSCSIQMRS